MGATRMRTFIACCAIAVAVMALPHPDSIVPEMQEIALAKTPKCMAFCAKKTGQLKKALQMGFKKVRRMPAAPAWLRCTEMHGLLRQKASRLEKGVWVEVEEVLSVRAVPAWLQAPCTLSTNFNRAPE